MGEAGMLTRVAAVPMGAEFTFAAPDTGNATAPGQLKVSELKDIFNILKIN
jgi:3-dehydroquinate dehydratase